MGNLAQLKFSNENGQYHMKLILNEKLDAIEFLESDKCNGLTIHLDSRVKTAIMQGNDYIHAHSIVELVKMLKEINRVDTD